MGTCKKHNEKYLEELGCLKCVAGIPPSTDEVTTERTLEAMDYNIRVKQQFIDKLLTDLVELQEENKRLREENVFLEHLRATSI